MKSTAKMRLLEALAKHGPSSGSDLVHRSGVPVGSAYVALERMVPEGLVETKGHHQERVWSITKAGRDVAKALRTLYDSEKL